MQYINVLLPQIHHQDGLSSPHLIFHQSSAWPIQLILNIHHQPGLISSHLLAKLNSTGTMEQLSGLYHVHTYCQMWTPIIVSYPWALSTFPFYHVHTFHQIWTPNTVTIKYSAQSVYHVHTYCRTQTPITITITWHNLSPSCPNLLSNMNSHHSYNQALGTFLQSVVSTFTIKYAWTPITASNWILGTVQVYHVHTLCQIWTPITVTIKHFAHSQAIMSTLTVKYELQSLLPSNMRGLAHLYIAL